MSGRLRQEGGFTLVELLVAMVLMLIVFGATLTLLEVFQRNNVTDETRNQAQDLARSTIDRLTGDLRNATSPCGAEPTASCSGASAGSIQRSQPYDVIFQEVDGSNTWGGNPSNQEWVRYCLDASNPSNETLWREVLTWTTSTPPAMPSTTVCPGATGGATGWPSSPAPVSVLTNLTNETTTPSRPQTSLFIYNIPAGATSPKSLGLDLVLNLNPSLPHPGETELRDSIDLRNSLSSPTANFTPSTVSGNVILDGSASSDPNGESLIYQWYVVSGSGATCPPTPPATGSGGSPTYSAGTLSGTYSFALVVTDSAGLSNCQTQGPYTY